ncbi:MAG: ABC transporter ATP-binding protein [Culicoidibacterales bacterium]
MSLLKVEHVVKIYGSKTNITHALNDISFEVENGDYVGIMGASGSGKTTLLNCLSTVDKINRGRILIENQDVSQLRGNQLSDFRKKNLGFIFQDYNLLDTLTAQENIALALTINKVPVDELLKRIEFVAEALGIKSVLDKYPAQLSGGQQQRVAAARAIVTNPKIVFADEPTGALDSKSASLLLESFTKMNTELGVSIMLVTHDAYVASHCKRVIFIKDGQIFNTLEKGTQTRKQFFERIIEVISILGGNIHDVD